MKKPRAVRLAPTYKYGNERKLLTRRNFPLLDPTEKAFWDEIIAYPDDDGPRLVYADWLEERGDPRGEFIRVQCARARCPSWHRDSLLLGWREKELLYRHGHHWRAQLPNLPGVAWKHFERGFITSARVINLDVLRQQAGSLTAHTPLNELRVMEPTANWDQTPTLPWLQKLRCGPEMYIDDMHRFSDSPLLDHLRVLELPAMNLENDGVVALARSPRLKNIERLDLRENFIGTAGAHTLAYTPIFRNLTHLSLRGVGFGSYSDDPMLQEVGVRELAQSPHWTKLQSLDISGNQIGANALEMILHAKNLSSLKYLDVSRNELGPGGAEVLRTTRSAMRLETLRIEETSIGDRGLIPLPQSPVLEKLRHLKMSACDLTSTGVEQLAKAIFRSTLQVLDLSGNSRISYSALRAVTESPCELHSLKMQNCELHATSKEGLTEALKDTRLLRLDLSGNSLDEKDIHRFVSAPEVTDLRELRLSKANIKSTTIQAMAHSTFLKNLRALELANNHLGKNALRTILEAPGLARLLELDLRDANLGARSLVWLPTVMPGVSLASLHIENNHLIDADFAALAQSALAPWIVELFWAHNNLGASIAQHLAKSPVWERLTTLNITACQIPDNALAALADSQVLPQLTNVDHWGNQSSASTMQRLLRRFLQFVD